jgi:Acetyltransferase (GNAT) family
MDRIDSSGITLDLVGPDELPPCGVGCVMDPRHEGFSAKVAWLRRRFAEGLRYLLFRDARGKPLAFLEYVPGEHARRPVDARGWLFVHCLWVYPRGQRVGGLGTRLIQACKDEADSAGALGVATLASDGPWMAGPRVFERAGFEGIDQADRFALLAYRLKAGPLPTLRDVEADRARYPGLHVVYAAQCPYLPKSVHDLRRIAAEQDIELRVSVLDTPEQAQSAPSYYGVFSLLWNGEVLSDHYVSGTRFRGILRRHGIRGDASAR